MTSRRIVFIPDHLEDPVAGGFEIQGIQKMELGDRVFMCGIGSTSSTGTFHQYGRHRPWLLTTSPLSQSRRLLWRR